MEAEIAESAAEVFSRFVSGGVAIGSTEIRDEINSGGIISGPLLVSAYLEKNEKVEEKCEKIEHALSSLRLIQPIPQAQYQEIVEKNWMESWKKNFKPLEIAKNFLVLPAWMDIPETDKNIIRIDPGLAFGTGVHPTTQLSLQLIEDQVSQGIAMFDIGCGSGILSIAGDQLGANPVYGADVDSEAIANAQMHAKLNKSRASFNQGSVQEISSRLLPIQQADLVVANILASILLRLLEEGLVNLVSPQGALILSGILEEQEGAIENALRKQNFHILKREKSGDWLAILAKRKSIY